MKILKWFAYLVLALVVAVGLFLFGARFADGPVEIIAGGPFRSGEMYTGTEPDWSFVRDISEVQFQLLEPARSRTTWIVEHRGKIYVPSGYMSTGYGKLWKQWPPEAEEDGRAILRINGKLYRRQLVRLKEGPAVEAIVMRLSEKYQVGATVGAVTGNYLWLFEMAPRN